MACTAVRQDAVPLLLLLLQLCGVWSVAVMPLARDSVDCLLMLLHASTLYRKLNLLPPATSNDTESPAELSI